MEEPVPLFGDCVYNQYHLLLHHILTSILVNVLSIFIVVEGH